MFDSVQTPRSPKMAPLANADLLTFRERLAGFDAALDDAARMERIYRLEELRAAVAAAQMVETAAFAQSRRRRAVSEIAATPRPGVGTRRRLAEAERGIVADVAIARRISPNLAVRDITMATAVPERLPSAFALLATGTVSEKRVHILHRATSWLAPELQRQVDAEVSAELPTWGDHQVDREARAAAYRLDPAGACARIAAAENDRHVSLRPAPDAMTWLSMLLPMAQGIAAFVNLDQAAKTARATGDPRSRGQVMADTAVQRLTGQAHAGAVPVAIELVITDQTLVGATAHRAAAGGAATNATNAINAISAGSTDHGEAERAGTRPTSGSATAPCRAATFDRDPASHGVPDSAAPAADRAGQRPSAGVAPDGPAPDGPAPDGPAPDGPAPDGPTADCTRDGLVEADVEYDEPARIVGYGPVPGEWARRLALGDDDLDRFDDTGAARTIRRLFTDPAGNLVAGETTARTFTPAMARLIRIRDDRCRTPWCDAPIRHIDHISSHTTGGPTAVNNGRGLCERCNYAQQAPGMRNRVTVDEGTAAVPTINIEITTPSGRTVTSRSPALVSPRQTGRRPPLRADSASEPLPNARGAEDSFAHTGEPARPGGERATANGVPVFFEPHRRELRIIDIAWEIDHRKVA